MTTRPNPQEFTAQLVAFCRERSREVMHVDDADPHAVVVTIRLAPDPVDTAVLNALSDVLGQPLKVVEGPRGIRTIEPAGFCGCVCRYCLVQSGTHQVCAHRCELKDRTSAVGDRQAGVTYCSQCRTLFDVNQIPITPTEGCIECRLRVDLQSKAESERRQMSRNAWLYETKMKLFFALSEIATGIAKDPVKAAADAIALKGRSNEEG